MRISDWSSDVCSSDLVLQVGHHVALAAVHQDAVAAVRRQHLPQRRLGVEALATLVEVERLDIAAEAQPAGVRRQSPDQHLYQGRFAGTVRADDAEAVAAPDARREVFEEGEVAEALRQVLRSEEHTSELQSLMRISYAVFCLKKKTT